MTTGSGMVARAAAIGATPETVIRTTVPLQGSPVAPLPEGLRADFTEHLRWVVAAAFAVPVPQNDPGDHDAGGEAPVTAAACAARRGHCCSRGGETAFLQPADIARWRRRAPQMPPDAIVDWYAGVLPAETIAAGCVYQAAAAAPRARRSEHATPITAGRCRRCTSVFRVAPGRADARVVMIVDDEAADEARGVVGWSAATGPGRLCGHPACRPAAHRAARSQDVCR